MDRKIHLIGNAHIDPVWMWQWQEGFAEIKATFRSALDRMNEFDDFKFTSACSSYYMWIEKSDKKRKKLHFFKKLARPPFSKPQISVIILPILYTKFILWTSPLTIY